MGVTIFTFARRILEGCKMGDRVPICSVYARIRSEPTELYNYQSNDTSMKDNMKSVMVVVHFFTHHRELSGGKLIWGSPYIIIR